MQPVLYFCHNASVIIECLLIHWFHDLALCALKTCRGIWFLDLTEYHMTHYFYDEWHNDSFSLSLWEFRKKAGKRSIAVGQPWEPDNGMKWSEFHFRSLGMSGLVANPLFCHKIFFLYCSLSVGLLIIYPSLPVGFEAQTWQSTRLLGIRQLDRYEGRQFLVLLVLFW